jgi:hypothetical protein
MIAKFEHCGARPRRWAIRSEATFAYCCSPAVDGRRLLADVLAKSTSQHELGSSRASVPNAIDCEHRVPLTDDLLKLLAELPRFRSGDHVFTTTFGKTSIAGFSKYTARLHRAMRAELGPDLPSFTLHDLRRTFRTRLSEVGVAERVAELCIAHAPRNALVRIYDQHRFEAEIRTAHERWHQRLRGIIEPPPANVVTLAARA